MRKFLLLAVMLFGAFFLSCEEPAEPCETNNYGWVIIHNTCGEALFVDATELGDNDNSEGICWNNSSRKIRVGAGVVIVWGATSENKDLNSWATSEIYVSACEEYDFTWSSKKSTEITRSK